MHTVFVTADGNDSVIVVDGQQHAASGAAYAAE
jgi:hypothetical protein